MKKRYQWAADAVVALHVAVAIFILVGWAFRDIQQVYLIVLIAWPLSWVFLGYCPLTKWELLLRRKNDPTINPNTEKIQYLAKKHLGLNIPSRPIFTGGIIVFFVLLGLSVVPNFL